MKKYRKKPVVIEAERWYGYEFTGGVAQSKRLGITRLLRAYDCKSCTYAAADHGWIETLEGGHIVCPRDWIIIGIEGERYPCKPDIFEATYEEVT